MALRMATEIITLAIDADVNKDYAASHALYQRALALFHEALALEKNPKTKEIILKRTVGYTERAGMVKMELARKS